MKFLKWIKSLFVRKPTPEEERYRRAEEMEL